MFDFTFGVCNILLASRQEWIVIHEQEHCLGYDHPFESGARDAWARYKQGAYMFVDKGPSLPGTAGATRWLMRYNNGQEFETQKLYTKEQIEQWETAKPVRPIVDKATGP